MPSLLLSLGEGLRAPWRRSKFPSMRCMFNYCEFYRQYIGRDSKANATNAFKRSVMHTTHELASCLSIQSRGPVFSYFENFPDQKDIKCNETNKHTHIWVKLNNSEDQTALQVASLEYLLYLNGKEDPCCKGKWSDWERKAGEEDGTFWRGHSHEWKHHRTNACLRRIESIHEKLEYEHKNSEWKNHHTCWTFKMAEE